MKNLLKIPLLLLIIILFSGCSGKRYSMTLTRPKTDFKHPGSVLILCHDKRPFVLNGEKKSTYVGRKFNGFGISVSTYTRSGKTLPEEIGEKIGASLADNGFYVKVSLLKPSVDFNPAEPSYDPAKYDRIILLVINMFREESFAEMEFLWDFHLKVLDDRGEILAQTRNKGVKEWNPSSIPMVTSGGAQRAVNMQTDTILSQMLNKADIIKHPTFTDDGRETDVSGSWKEKWTFLGCGYPVDVWINFYPDGHGGTRFVCKGKDRKSDKYQNIAKPKFKI